jgi:hypothetical protein
LQHRRIATAVVIGGYAVDQLQLRAFDAIQLDLDITPWAAVSGIQYMCCQTSHGSRMLVARAPDEHHTSSTRLKSTRRTAATLRQDSMQVEYKTFLAKIVHNKIDTLAINAPNRFTSDFIESPL